VDRLLGSVMKNDPRNHTNEQKEMSAGVMSDEKMALAT
jgi:hypothetical protein